MTFLSTQGRREAQGNLDDPFDLLWDWHLSEPLLTLHVAPGQCSCYPEEKTPRQCCYELLHLREVEVALVEGWRVGGVEAEARSIAWPSPTVLCGSTGTHCVHSPGEKCPLNLSSQSPYSGNFAAHFLSLCAAQTSSHLFSLGVSFLLFYARGEAD
ncbi:hypothetical protein E2C01_102425 [Portunus trituberculatus]|uniref:Uncharacterized protein n=1 Tax=Portunus trituberculatus TaxID=210409 RepID=A0A5B7KP62_PORTR|nr:hypothetical protein [Portunus trituberculatus]